MADSMEYENKATLQPFTGVIIRVIDTRSSNLICVCQTPRDVLGLFCRGPKRHAYDALERLLTTIIFFQLLFDTAVYAF